MHAPAASAVVHDDGNDEETCRPKKQRGVRDTEERDRCSLLIGACPRAAAIATSVPVTSMGTTRNLPTNPTRRCIAGLLDAISETWTTSKSIHAVNSAPWTWKINGNDGVGKRLFR